MCEYGIELDCFDSFDNDGDGDMDCVDNDCNYKNYCEDGQEVTCDDNFDNDGDGLKDCADLDCGYFVGCPEMICNDNDDNLEMGKQIMIGTANPFGNFFGTVLVKYKLRNTFALFGILGPMRMDYEKCDALLDFINRELKI